MITNTAINLVTFVFLSEHVEQLYSRWTDYIQI
jgi:hypothetical protein